MTPERKAEILNEQADLKLITCTVGSILWHRIKVVDECLDAITAQTALLKSRDALIAKLAEMLEGCVSDLCSKKRAVKIGCGRCISIHDLLQQAEKIGGGK